MTEFMDLPSASAGEHAGINGYGAAFSLRRRRDLHAGEIRDFVRQLITAISAGCLGRGAKDIGHIKAFIDHDTGFLFADTVGDDPDAVTVQGRDGGPARRVKLTVNAVVYGISRDAVKQATEDSLNAVLTKFGFVIEKSARRQTGDGND